MRMADPARIAQFVRIILRIRRHSAEQATNGMTPALYCLGAVDSATAVLSCLRDGQLTDRSWSSSPGRQARRGQWRLAIARSPTSARTSTTNRPRVLVERYDLLVVEYLQIANTIRQANRCLIPTIAASSRPTGMPHATSCGLGRPVTPKRREKKPAASAVGEVTVATAPTAGCVHLAAPSAPDHTQIGHKRASWKDGHRVEMDDSR